MEKKELAIITFGDDYRRFFVDPKEISNATFADFAKGDWSYDDMGLNPVGKNDNGEELFESTCGNFEGQKTWEEIKEIETDCFAVSYWDGNNWQYDMFECYDPQQIEIETLDPPSPAYYFPYVLTLEDGEKVECFRSNESGSLSPYYCEEVER